MRDYLRRVSLQRFLTPFSIILLVLCVSSTARAQTEFIEEVPWGDLTIPTGMTELKDSILENELYASVTPIEIGDLSSTQDTGVLCFKIPGRSDTIFARADWVAKETSGDFLWAGRFMNKDGDLFFIKHDGDMFGRINFDTTAYEIFDFGSGNNILMQFDTTSFEY